MRAFEPLTRRSSSSIGAEETRVAAVAKKREEAMVKNCMLTVSRGGSLWKWGA